ncbi:hypothetical protein Tco_0064884 [Tanacetum coccineum]
MNDHEYDDESVDTPLVSSFPHSDNDSDDGEVLNELSEYENAGVLRRERIINGFDGDDLAFQCMIGFRKIEGTRKETSLPSLGSFSKKTKIKFCSEAGDGVRIYPDDIVSPPTGKFENFQVIFDEKKLGGS